MSDRCETVRIVAPTKQGFAVINKEDFDGGRHVLFVDPPAKSSDEPASSAAGLSVDEALDAIAEKKKPTRVTKPKNGEKTA